jgi:hypothetical protein
MTKPAVLEYGPGQFRVVSQGNYVVCAVSGQRIALERLKYWSVEHQEAYVSLDAVHKRRDELSGEQE